MTALEAGDKAPAFEFSDVAGNRWDSKSLLGSGKDGEGASRGWQPRAVVLVFTRYAGCPICQLDVSRLGRSLAEFRAKQARVVILTRSLASSLGPLAALAPGAVLVSDPGGDIYRLFGVGTGSLLQYAAPAVLARAKKAGAAGFAHGPREGDERQLPAAFILGPDGVIAWARYGRHIADSSPPEELLAHLP